MTDIPLSQQERDLLAAGVNLDERWTRNMLAALEAADLGYKGAMANAQRIWAKNENKGKDEA